MFNFEKTTLEKKGELPTTPDTLPETRAPPQANLFY